MALNLEPTSVTERYHLLDVLRGFALSGVLLANMQTHSGYFFLSEPAKQALGTADADHIVEWIEHFLIEGKFYSLFSMLFGIGFALQMKRAAAFDTSFLPRFRRRLVIMVLLLSAVILLLLPVVQYAIFWGLNLANPPATVPAAAAGEQRLFDQLIRI